MQSHLVKPGLTIVLLAALHRHGSKSFCLLLLGYLLSQACQCLSQACQLFLWTPCTVMGTKNSNCLLLWRVSCSSAECKGNVPSVICLSLVSCTRCPRAAAPVLTANQYICCTWTQDECHYSQRRLFGLHLRKDTVCVCVQLVWVCLHGTDYGLPRHIILLLRLARMRCVFTLIKVGTAAPSLPRTSYLT